ncbi:MAG: type 4a pilus biogenesis protein PilO [Candidatus Omnitrophota bacterium]|jgi:type IV pilus assembly protein PilO
MMKLPFDLSSIDLKKAQPQVLILAALVSGVVLIALIFFILIPQVNKITDVLSKTGKAMSDLKEAEYQISRIDKYKTDIATFKEKVDLYEKKLPAEQEIPSLLENLSTLAKKSSISIVGITPVAPVAAKDQKAQKSAIYQEFPILVSAKSGYHELGSFLSSLENADRFMKVVDIEVNLNKTTPKKHDVDLMVYTYILLKEK